MRELLIGVVCFVLTATTVFAQSQITFKTTTETNEIAQAEPFALTFQLTNAHAPDLFLPNLPNLEILDGPVVAQSIAIANGQKTKILSFQYLVQANFAGETTIPAIKITLENGTTVQSLPLTISVKEGNALGAASRIVPARERRLSKLR
jgi:hypothetical protein